MHPPRVAVVAAAGKGQRIHPRSARLPKVMLEVGGKPLLTRHLELLRDQLGIPDVHLVVGHLAERIRAAYGDGSRFGVRIHYVDNPAVDRGLGTALLAVEPHVDEPFVMLLGDELYLESNHAELATLAEPYTAVCGLHATEDTDLISKNYAVTIDAGRITGLVEKPESAPNGFVGCGTYVFTPEIFESIDRTKPGAGGEIQLTDAIGGLLSDRDVYGYTFDEGRYDIGSKLDYLRATVELALARQDLGPEFRAWLSGYVREQGIG